MLLTFTAGEHRATDEFTAQMLPLSYLNEVELNQDFIGAERLSGNALRELTCSLNTATVSDAFIRLIKETEKRD